MWAGPMEAGLLEALSGEPVIQSGSLLPKLLAKD